MLNDMQIRLAKALDALKLDDKTRVHIQDSFESDEIRVEMKFRTREQFINQIEKLVRASGSDALDELIRIFQNPQDWKDPPHFVQNDKQSFVSYFKSSLDLFPQSPFPPGPVVVRKVMDKDSSPAPLIVMGADNKVITLVPSTFSQ